MGHPRPSLRGLDVEAGRLLFGWVKGLAAGIGQVKIDAGVHRGAPLLLAAGVLNAVEGLAEHGVVGLLPVEEEVDGVPHPLVVDLAVEVLVDHLGPLLGGDVREDVGCQVAGLVDVGGRPEIAGGVGQHGGQPGEDVGLHVPHGGVGGVQVMAVEQVDRGGHHLHVAELLGGHVQKQVLDLRVLDAHALGQVLQGGLQLALGPAQLLLQHGGVVGVGPVHLYFVKQLFVVFEQRFFLLWRQGRSFFNGGTVRSAGPPTGIERGAYRPRRPRVARRPSSSSIASRRLYLQTRSLRAGAPVLICPAESPTARSAIEVSSVSPLRWERMAR